MYLRIYRLLSAGALGWCATNCYGNILRLQWERSESGKTGVTPQLQLSVTLNTVSSVKLSAQNTSLGIFLTGFPSVGQVSSSKWWRWYISWHVGWFWDCDCRRCRRILLIVFNNPNIKIWFLISSPLAPLFSSNCGSNFHYASTDTTRLTIILILIICFKIHKTNSESATGFFKTTCYTATESR